MPSNLDLSFYPYLADGALWHGIPLQVTTTVPAWQWMPRLRLTHEGTLAVINQLLANGWERLEGDRWRWNDKQPQLNSARYLRLMGQLSDVRLLNMSGQSDHELWVRTADIRRAEAFPVTLAFAWLEDVAGITAEDFPGAAIVGESEHVTTLQIAEVLPPPQFGEIALVDYTRGGRAVWETYTLSALGDAGLDLWQRMGAALKELTAPAEWWPYTTQLLTCVRGEYDRLREAFRSKLLATRGKEREAWRTQLAQLEIDRKHADAMRAAKTRALQDPVAWLARWEEVRQMAAELVEMYWEAHLAATAIPATVAEIETETEAKPGVDTTPTSEPVTADSEGAAMLAQLEANTAANMDSTSYQEDRAVREASLAPKAAWQTEADVPRFKASNDQAVYFMDREHPLRLADAQAQLLRITPGTMLTMRIALGLWNIRRHNPQYTRNGRVAITYEEILEWRGVKKHSKLAYPGTDSEQRRTDGYRLEGREGVREDFTLASRLWLRGKHTIARKNRYEELNIDAPYMNVGFVSRSTLWGTEEPLGVFIEPGDWIGDYENVGNHYLAEIDRRIFQLNPQNEQHELKIAFYITERWREQARDGSYAEPITMADLLRLSVIPIDRPNLTSRFAPRIEQAIENLRQRGIGTFDCLTPIDKTKARWGKEWLAARWRILPPDDLMQNYIAKGITKDAPQLPPGRKR